MQHKGYEQLFGAALGNMASPDQFTRMHGQLSVRHHESTLHIDRMRGDNTLLT